MPSLGFGMGGAWGDRGIVLYIFIQGEQLSPNIIAGITEQSSPSKILGLLLKL